MATPQRIISPEIMVPGLWMPPPLERAMRLPVKSNLGRQVRSILHYAPRDARAELLDRLVSCAIIESQLALKVIRGEESLANYLDRRLVEDYGAVGYKVVTNNGVAFIVDAFQNSVEVENLKFHGIGTGSTAENATDSALVTELTTEYNPDNTRATGSLTEGASANIFRTVGTNTLDGTPGAALREHGVFSAAAAGTLLDRTVFSAITLSSGDSLQSTYDLTVTAGG